MEVLKGELARDYGFRLNDLAMPMADTPVAARMIERQFTQMQESQITDTEEMPANLRFEPEDAFDIEYTDAATGLTVTRALIANNISYSIGPAKFTMQIGSRRRLP